MVKTTRPMPKWTPAPDALVGTFERAVASFPEAQARKMFGYPAAFVRGQMLNGLFQDQMFVRLAEDDRAELLETPGARSFEPMPGRPMREYVVVPPSVVSSEARLRLWLAKGLSYVKSLPPKPGRSERTATKRAKR